MKIKKLNLLYFRNYNFLNINLHPNLNIFVGNNANGKTNIIESLYLLSLGKSFRTKRDSECIKFGEEATCVSCELDKDGIHNDIMLAINKKGKNAKISGVKRNKIIDFVGELNVVLFAPDDLQLIKGSPSLRRDFIDREFYQFSRLYHKYSLLYKHLLKQRNTFLKEIRKKKQDDISKYYLETLTTQLANIFIYITKERYILISELSNIARKHMDKISSGNEYLRVHYKSSVFESLGVKNITDINFNEKKLVEVMMNKIKEDINLGSTKIGPQHDDILFYINDKEVKNFASQGQQRSFVLSLRLAEIDILKKKTGHLPILLLDDVFSELDKSRQIRLLNSIDEEIQTFITTPTISDVGEHLLNNASVFIIENGNIL